MVESLYIPINQIMTRHHWKFKTRILICLTTETFNHTQNINYPTFLQDSFKKFVNTNIHWLVLGGMAKIPVFSSSNWFFTPSVTSVTLTSYIQLEHVWTNFFQPKLSSNHHPSTFSFVFDRGIEKNVQIMDSLVRFSLEDNQRWKNVSICCCRQFSRQAFLLTPWRTIQALSHTSSHDAKYQLKNVGGSSILSLSGNKYFSILINLTASL